MSREALAYEECTGAAILCRCTDCEKHLTEGEVSDTYDADWQGEETGYVSSGPYCYGCSKHGCTPRNGNCYESEVA